jgi:hypothetical protein
LFFSLKIGALLELTSWNFQYIDRSAVVPEFQRCAEKDALMAAISFLETRRNHKKPN